jgi:hypothetical protein
MSKLSTALLAAVAFTTLASNAHAWDHPGHMWTAKIAFSEIERARPELIEKIGMLFLAHPDPNKDQPADQLVKNMVNFILNGESPVEEAPQLPDAYWEKLQSTAERRLTLARYRIADLLISAADQIEVQRKFIGR